MAKGDLVLTAKLDLSSLRDFERDADQFPFAISLAMNRTAKGPGVDHMRDGLSSADGARFTVRNKWTRGGIAFFKSATKHDHTVRIGAINDYLRAQTVGSGDTSRPEGDGPLGAVPLGPTRDPKTKTTARRNEWPLRLIERGLAFRPGIDHTRRSKRVEVTSAKTGKPRRVKVKDRPDPLQPGQVLFSTTKHPSGWGTALWLIAADADVVLRPVYPAARLSREAFSSAFPDELRKAIRFAIKTKRRTPPR